MHIREESIRWKLFGANADIRKTCDEVAYHGGDIEKYLREVDGLYAPRLMHSAEEDEFISKAAQAEIKATLATKSNSSEARQA